MSITDDEMRILKTAPLKDAEAYTGIRRHVLKQCIYDGKLRGYIFAGGRQIRVSLEDLANLLVPIEVEVEVEGEPTPESPRSNITAAARAAMAEKRRATNGEKADDPA